MKIRRRIEVSGIVQGVGFRPYVYRLAQERALTGNVRNTSRGATIELQGPREQVEEFLRCLPTGAPPLARITRIEVQELACHGEAGFSGEHGFQIVASERGAANRTLIAADVAVCADCLRELLDPADRRYRYPFINCTNCGPRFTIIHGVPYDRRLTSMAGFQMCPQCQAEYTDPGNRRFHAQPNACWKCGPRLSLWNEAGEVIACADPVAAIIPRLLQGEIIAIKGLGGFHLAADATGADAVRKLRARKNRFEKPLALMVADLETAQELCELDEAGAAALVSPQRPIVLLPKRQSCAIPAAIAAEIAPHRRELGLFLPYTPLHHLLFAGGTLKALVMTSANLSEEPIVTGNHEAIERLSGIADAFLVHNRDIVWRCDDSVVRAVGGRVRQLRRSRGFVPVPVLLHKSVPPILAVGGELKNTICAAKGREAFLSPHIGDLENAASAQFFDDVIEHLARVLDIEPAAIAYDLHPRYFSTQWALDHKGVKLIGVQHHHAHIASCMAENRLDGRVIGFALDGTGYGADGNIWGGEVLLAGYEGFTRAAHFDYVPMPGGEQAIRQPWRMAVSYLARHYGRAFLTMDLPFVHSLDRHATELLLQMMERHFNAPATSSCGRLFDAVAALTGIRQKATYEGQAAIELEAALDILHDPGSARAYPLELRRQAGRSAVEEGGATKPPGAPWLIDTRPLFAAILADLRKQTPVSSIAARFHCGLVETFVRLAQLLRDESGLDRVCLSGGCFHNAFLLTTLTRRLELSGFRVFSQSAVPSGDGGLSLGQVMVAARSMK